MANPSRSAAPQRAIEILFRLLSQIDFNELVRGSSEYRRYKLDIIRPRALWIFAKDKAGIPTADRVHDQLELLGFIRPDVEAVSEYVYQTLKGLTSITLGDLLNTIEIGSSTTQLLHGSSSCSDRIFGPANNSSPVENMVDSGDTESTTTSGLREAFDQWQSNIDSEEWRSTGIELPDHTQILLDEVHVELEMFDAKAAEQHRPLRPPLREQPGRTFNSRSPLHQVLRSVYHGSCSLIVGEPGAGKTSLAKRLVLDIVRYGAWGYAGAIYIPLRGWSNIPYRLDSASIFRYFLDTNASIPNHPFEQLAVNLKDRIKRSRQLIHRDKPVLVILDGWDETPESDRPQLIEAIRIQLRGVPTLITSRPSGYPKRLVHSQVFEIASLGRTAQDKLVTRFFRSAKEPEAGQKLIERIAHSDLDNNYTGNPFLLSLLCKIWLDKPTMRESLGGAHFTRTELYQFSIDSILKVQNERGGGPVLNRRDLTPLESMSFRLLLEEQNPQFVFSENEPEVCPIVLKPVFESLKESRLLSVTNHRDGYIQFLHASIQEYLAACKFAQLPINEQAEFFPKAIFEWYTVVFRFLIGLQDADARAEFWDQMRWFAHDPDKGGLIDLALAHLLAEAGVTDGGKTLLGIDLRPRIWDRIKNNFDLTSQAEGLAQLDTPWLATKLIKTVKQADGQNNKTVDPLNMLDRHIVNAGRLSHLQTSGYETLWEDLCIWFPSIVMAQYSPDELLVLLENDNADIHQRVMALNQLVRWRDDRIINILAQRTHNAGTCAIWPELVESAGRLGGSAAASALSDLLLNPDALRCLEAAIDDIVNRPPSLERLRRDYHPTNAILRDKFELGSMSGDGARYAVINALQDHVDCNQSDLLLWELARSSADSPVIVSILEVLQSQPITHAARVAMSWATQNKHPAHKAAAISSLEGSLDPEVSSYLVEVAKNHVNSNFRRRALVAMMSWLQVSSVDWIVERILGIEEHVDDIERNACVSVLSCAIRREYPEEVVNISERGLQKCLDHVASSPHRSFTLGNTGFLAHEIVSEADALGTAAVKPLLDIAGNSNFNDNLRSAALRILSKIDTKDDQKQQIFALAMKILRSISRHPTLECEVTSVIASVDPEFLMLCSAPSVEEALCIWSIDTGCLVFQDRIQRPTDSLKVDQSDQLLDTGDNGFIEAFVWARSRLKGPKQIKAFSSLFWAHQNNSGYTLDTITDAYRLIKESYEDAIDGKTCPHYERAELPSCETWKKSLSRARGILSNQPKPIQSLLLDLKLLKP